MEELYVTWASEPNDIPTNDDLELSVKLDYKLRVDRQHFADTFDVEVDELLDALREFKTGYEMFEALMDREWIVFDPEHFKVEIEVDDFG